MWRQRDCMKMTSLFSVIILGSETDLCRSTTENQIWRLVALVSGCLMTMSISLLGSALIFTQIWTGKNCVNLCSLKLQYAFLYSYKHILTINTPFVWQNIKQHSSKQCCSSCIQTTQMTLQSADYWLIFKLFRKTDQEVRNLLKNCMQTPSHQCTKSHS